MKSIILGAFLCAIAFVCSAAGEQPGVQVLQQGGTQQGVQSSKYTVWNCGTGLTCTYSGGKFNMVSTSAPAPAAWDALTSPTGGATLDMKQFAQVLNWTVNSSTANLFSFADFATNTGTGYLLTVSTGATSTVKPFRVCYRGTSNCITFDSGTLAAIGTALIDSNTLLTKTWASPAAIGTGTPAAITGTTITATSQFSGSGAGLTSIPQSGIAAGNYTIGAYYIDQAEIAAPANPGAGVCREYVDSTTHLKTWKNSAGTSCGPSASGGTIASTTNVLKGDNAGNAVSAGFAATAAGIVSLFNSGTCSGYLKSDGTCATPGGTGTVTVVSSGALNSTSLVTGGGTTTLQTPSNGSTLDSSGNMVLAGSLTTSGPQTSGTAPAGILNTASGVWGCTESGSTGLTPTATTSWLHCDSASHQIKVSLNGAAEVNMLVSGGALGTPASGTLTNATGLPAASVVAGALANGMTATTQADSSNDTKVATDAYVDAQNIIVTTGLTAGHAYYVSAANTLADAGGALSATVAAVCVATSTTVCRTRGIYTTTGLTAGSIYYVPTTAAAVTATKPTSTGNYVQRVGVAYSTTVLIINPSLDVGTVQ